MIKKNTRYYYVAYGLKIESEVKLAELIASQESFYEKTDVKIVYGQLPNDLFERYLGSADYKNTPGGRFRVTEKAVGFEFEKIGRVLILEGQSVTIDFNSPYTGEDLMPFFTGPVLIFLLQQRGHLVLHASAVLLHETAVAFAGFKGFGKSTTAAYLSTALGHQLMTDDIVPITFIEDKIYTYSGYPRIKLLPDSVAGIGLSPQNLPLVNKSSDKHALKCSNQFFKGLIPLSCIYVLNESEEINIERLSPATAMIEVTKHSHLIKNLKQLNYQETHFKSCQKLVQTIPLFNLNRPHDFARIQEVGEVLEKHVRSLNTNRELVKTADLTVA